MIKLKNIRATPEFLGILKSRRDNFGTSLPKEQNNVLKIIQELENNLGFDIREVPVTKKGVVLNTKYKIRVFK